MVPVKSQPGAWNVAAAQKTQKAWASVMSPERDGAGAALPREQPRRSLFTSPTVIGYVMFPQIRMWTS